MLHSTKDYSIEGKTIVSVRRVYISVWRANLTFLSDGIAEKTFPDVNASSDFELEEIAVA